MATRKTNEIYQIVEAISILESIDKDWPLNYKNELVQRTIEEIIKEWKDKLHELLDQKMLKKKPSKIREG
jgi:hypothetical protein